MRHSVPILEGDVALCAHLDPGGVVQVSAQLEDLATLYLKGVRRLLLVRISGGPREVMAIDKGMVDRFNRLLESRGLDQVEVKSAGSRSKASTLLLAHTAEAVAAKGRRRLFNQVAEVAKDDTEIAALEQLQNLGANQTDALFAVVPRIDPAACTGCDICLRVCPRDVLTHINDSDEGESYNINPAGCDACGLCVDLCTFSAIGLEYMTQRPDRIDLASWTCQACGVVAHAPKEYIADDTLCEICLRTGHHKKLFQVLS